MVKNFLIYKIPSEMDLDNLEYVSDISMKIRQGLKEVNHMYKEIEMDVRLCPMQYHVEIKGKCNDSFKKAFNDFIEKVGYPDLVNGNTKCIDDILGLYGKKSKTTFSSLMEGGKYIIDVK